MGVIPSTLAPGKVPVIDPGPLGRQSTQFTPRESEILRLIACDRSDKEIALTLGISTNTLRTHLSRIFRRHRVHSRAAAVAWWLLGEPPWRRLTIPDLASLNAVGR